MPDPDPHLDPHQVKIRTRIRIRIRIKENAAPDLHNPFRVKINIL
jgi:hypothetical protein